MMNFLKVFVVLLTFFIYDAAYAKCARTYGSEDNKDVVVYINGINNSQADACESKEKLAETLNFYGLSGYYVTYIYNPKGTWLPSNLNIPEDDLDEMVTQALLSTEASKLANADLANGISKNYKNMYYFNLGKIYTEKSLSYFSGTGVGAWFDGENVVGIASDTKKALEKLVQGNKNVVVVAHSQGNFVIEAAIAMLIYEGKQNIVNKIKVVSVAPVSMSTYNDKYILGFQDSSVNVALSSKLTNNNIQNYTTLNSNTLFCDLQNNPLPVSVFPQANHGFLEAYNTISNKICGQPTLVRKQIFNLVADSIAELYSATPPSANITILTPNPTAGSNVIFQYELNSANGGVVETQWDFGDGVVTDVLAPTSETWHTYTTAGTYTAKLKIKDAKGVTNTIEKIVVVAPVASTNLLLGATVTDSCPMQSCPAIPYGISNTLTDGNIATARNLGTYSGSFNIFTTDPKSIAQLRLLPSMSPNGIVSIEAQTSTDATGAAGTWTSHGIQSRGMADKTWFNINLTPNTTNIRVVKIIFHSSPSWVALFEVEGYAP